MWNKLSTDLLYISYSYTEIESSRLEGSSKMQTLGSILVVTTLSTVMVLQTNCKKHLCAMTLKPQSIVFPATFERSSGQKSYPQQNFNSECLNRLYIGLRASQMLQAIFGFTQLWHQQLEMWSVLKTWNRRHSGAFINKRSRTFRPVLA